MSGYKQQTLNYSEDASYVTLEAPAAHPKTPATLSIDGVSGAAGGSAGQHAPGGDEAACLAKAKANLAKTAAVRIACNAALLSSDPGGQQTGKAPAMAKAQGKSPAKAAGKAQSKAHGGVRAKAKGRPKKQQAVREISSGEAGSSAAATDVKCFAGRLPPKDKATLEEFVGMVRGYKEIKSKTQSARHGGLLQLLPPTGKLP